eukprot:scaffold464328_cov18-Prasinocladus_malaysianus.AAC.1
MLEWHLFSAHQNDCGLQLTLHELLNKQHDWCLGRADGRKLWLYRGKTGKQDKDLTDSYHTFIAQMHFWLPKAEDQIKESTWHLPFSILDKGLTGNIRQSILCLF